MKIIKTEYLVDSKKIRKSSDYKVIENEITTAIKKVRWPKKAKKFSIYPERKANGVVPIKEACMISLKKDNWQLEERLDIATNVRPGPIDAYKDLNGLKVAVEWETGNISSSHRAVNKMAIGLLDNKLDAGFLILPSREFYQYLTDRVGNFLELEPYFPMWKSLNLTNKILAIIEVEHDETSTKVPKIKKGTDGRALI
ncbi:MAG: restriction endonuclease [Balneola sp.]